MAALSPFRLAMYPPGGEPSSDGLSGTVGDTQFRQISPTADPTFRRLARQTQEAIPAGVEGLESIIQGGMNSPLLQAILGPALQRLQAPQQQQRQQLTEATRAAGGLRGSQYGNQFNQLLNTQGLQVNDLIGQVIQQTLSPIIQGQLQSQRNRFLPAESLINLLRTIAPNIVSGRMATPTVTGGGGGGGSSGSSFLSSPYSTPGYFDTPGYGRGQPAPAGGYGSVYQPQGGTMQPAASQPAPYTPYLDPFEGGGNAIQQNPYTGVYETVTPTYTDPYQHESYNLEEAYNYADPYGYNYYDPYEDYNYEDYSGYEDFADTNYEY